MTAQRPTSSTQIYAHLPARWRDSVILDLRARGASGARIGDALAMAEAHCAESGEGPDEAFGTAKEYAAALPLSEAERPDTTAELAAVVLPSVVGLTGMMLAFAATNAWQAGQDTEVSWGALVGTAAIVAATVAFARWMHVIVTHVWVLGALFGAVIVAYVALTLTQTSIAFALPTPVSVVVSVALLAVGTLWSRRGTDVDPVVDPLRGDPSPRATRLAVAIQPWMLPLLTVFGVLLFLLIGSAA